MEQITKYKPPPNAVKPTDSRTAEYVRTYGMHTCWELDALPPNVLIEVIRKGVLAFRDEKKWDAALAVESNDKDQLDLIIEENT